jgi:hypothetical protein
MMSNTPLTPFDTQAKGLKSLHVPMPEALQVKLRACDAVLAHYSLPHSIAPNLSPGMFLV